MSFEYWAKHFLEKRVEREKFDVGKHSFYTHSPLRQFVQLLYTGYLTDTFYMKRSEIYAMSRELHLDVAFKEPEFHLSAIKLARSEALLKDQPLIGVLVRLRPALMLRDRSFEEHVDILSSYPPNQLLKKFVEPVKRKEFGYGLGRHVKKLLHNVFDTWHERGLLGYYVLRYKSAIKDLLRLVHYPLREQDYARVLFNRDVDKIADEKLKAYVKFKEYVKQKKYKDAGIVAYEYDLPFEIIRVNIPKSEYRFEEVYKAILKTITPRGLVMFAVPFVRAGIPKDELLKELRRKVVKSNVTSFEVIRPTVVSYKLFGMEELTRELGEVYTSKIVDVWRQIDTSFLKVSQCSIALVLDASASMEGGGLVYRRRKLGCFDRSLIALAPLAYRVKRLILFSNFADEEDVNLLKTYGGLMELDKIYSSKYDDMTNIASGLALAKQYVDNGEVDTVILSTDEQANVNKEAIKEYDLIRRMVEKGAKVIIHNPSPYPVHIAKPIEEVTYVYGDRVESIIGSLRVQAMKDLKDEEVKELILTKVGK